MKKTGTPASAVPTSPAYNGQVMPATQASQGALDQLAAQLVQARYPQLGQKPGEAAVSISFADLVQIVSRGAELLGAVPPSRSRQRQVLDPASAAPDIKAMREGLDRAELDAVAALAALTKKEMGALLGMSERNRYYATTKRLSLLESEHLTNLKALFEAGLTLFEGNVDAFSAWLRAPKQALAAPETGFSPPLPATYRKPTLGELLTPHTEQENQAAIQQNLAFNQAQISNQDKPFPSPLSLLDSPTGLRLVGELLGRIEAGVYA